MEGALQDGGEDDAGPSGSHWDFWDRLDSPHNTVLRLQWKDLRMAGTGGGEVERPTGRLAHTVGHDFCDRVPSGHRLFHLLDIVWIYFWFSMGVSTVSYNIPCAYEVL